MLNNNLNFRYNQDTDMLEILFNEEWHPWKYANLQANYLYKDGEEFTAWVVSGYTQHADLTLQSAVKNASSISLNVTATGKVSFIGTNDIIDLSKYNELLIESTYNGSEHTDVINITDVVNGYIAIYLSNTTSASTIVCRVLKTKNLSGTTYAYISETLISGGTNVYKNMVIKRIYLI